MNYLQENLLIWFLLLTKVLILENLATTSRWVKMIIFWKKLLIIFKQAAEKEYQELQDQFDALKAAQKESIDQMEKLLDKGTCLETDHRWPDRP